MAAPVTTSLGGGLGAAGLGFGGAGVYGSTMATPMMTEVVAAPAITTMAARAGVYGSTMATPMMTEVVAAPLATTYGALPSTVAAAPHTGVIGLDLNHNGQADAFVIGADRNFDGIPDVLKQFGVTAMGGHHKHHHHDHHHHHGH